MRNAEAVTAALETPPPQVDTLTCLCPNTLVKPGYRAAPLMHVLPVGAVLALAQWQPQR